MTNNIQLIQTIYETMFRRDEAGALALMDDEIEIINPPEMLEILGR